MMKKKIAKMKTKITGKTKFNILLKEKPESAEILLSEGMFCIGCPASAGETIEQGCLTHGMNKKQIENLIKKLNK